MAALSISLLLGCSPHYERREPGYSWEQPTAPIRPAVEAACQRLMQQADSPALRQSTLLVASFANLDRLSESSALGRLLGQQCAARVVNAGYQVAELLLAESVYVDPSQGELLLSRDLDQIAERFAADHVIVGTYSVGQKAVHLTAKLIRASDARVLSATSFELPMGQEVRALIR